MKKFIAEADFFDELIKDIEDRLLKEIDPGAEADEVIYTGKIKLIVEIIKED